MRFGISVLVVLGYGGDFAGSGDGVSTTAATGVVGAAVGCLGAVCCWTGGNCDVCVLVMALLLVVVEVVLMV